ncbi:MAG: carboxymuconolactone decarboxylase family protein [Streptosporangiales bacterium]
MKIRASQINGCAACTDMHTKDAQHAGETPCGSTWSRCGGRRRSSARPSGPPWSSPSRAPASPMPPVVSPTRPGRTRPSTMTTTSSPRWWRSSPSSTPTTV